jgi:hypothetical protein
MEMVKTYLQMSLLNSQKHLNENLRVAYATLIYFLPKNMTKNLILLSSKFHE